MVGFFLAKAAWDYDPKKAIGIDEALLKLAHAEYGRLWLGLEAAGLFACTALQRAAGALPRHLSAAIAASTSRSSL